MKVSLYNYAITFTDNDLVCAKILKKFYNMAEDYADEMSLIYDRYVSLKNVVQYSEKAVAKIYDNVINFSVQMLMDYKIYNINKERFTELCSEYMFNFIEALSEVYEKYLELVGEKEMASQYRKYRKDSRSKFVGGGFGFAGAVKGMAVAGAANMATGFLHSMFNILDSAVTNASINSQMNKIYKDPKTKQSLVYGVYNDIKSIVYPLCSIINKKYPDFEMTYTDESVRNAETIYQNILDDVIPDEQLIEAVVDMLCNAPFKDEYYLLAYYLFGDENNELSQLAEIFDISIDIKRMKKADDNAKSFFGDNYSKFEYAMSKNIFFKSSKEHLGKPLSELCLKLTEVLDKEINSYMVCFFDTSAKSERLGNSLNTFAFCQDNEMPLFLFDNTIFATGKEGFVLTNKNIYYSGGCIKLADINSIKNEWGLKINGKSIPTSSMPSSKLISQIIQLIEFIALISPYYNESYNQNETLDTSMNTHNSQCIDENFVIEYASSLLKNINNEDIKNKIFIFSDDEKSLKKIGNAINSYAQLNNEEYPIICYDNTLFGSSKDGCLLTTKGIYVHNPFSSPKFFNYEEIENVELKGTFGKELYINDYEVQTTLLNGEAKNIFCSIINKVIRDFQ